MVYSMTKVIADIGATGSKFAILHNGKDPIFKTAEGFNPFLKDLSVLTSILDELPVVPEDVKSVHLFGAGFITTKMITTIKTMTETTFGNASTIELGDDILGTCKAHATQNQQAVITAIGTGTCHALWDGFTIAKQVPALGFILGDHGSGAHIGRDILEAGLIQDLTGDAKKAFDHQVKSYSDIANYISKPSIVATWARLASSYKEQPEIQTILRKNFKNLAENVLKDRYNKLNLPHIMVGSISNVFKTEVRTALQDVGISNDNIRFSNKSTIQGLAQKYAYQ